MDQIKTMTFPPLSLHNTMICNNEQIRKVYFYPLSLLSFLLPSKCQALISDFLSTYHFAISQRDFSPFGTDARLNFFAACLFWRRLCCHHFSSKCLAFLLLFSCWVSFPPNFSQGCSVIVWWGGGAINVRCAKLYILSECIPPFIQDAWRSAFVNSDVNLFNFNKLNWASLITVVQEN